MNICYSTDNNYAPYCGVAILSVIEAHPNEEIHFYIFDCGISEENKKKLQKTVVSPCTLEIIPVREDVFENYKINENLHITSATFYRIKIPEIFAHLDRVLYLDVDTLVLGNLHPFYDVDMSEKSLGMIEEGWLAPRERTGVKKYYNAGVMLFDIKNCRKNNITERLIKGCEIYPSLPLMDQDLINLTCQNDIESIPSIFNVQYTLFEKLYNQAMIIHYTTKHKPWTLSGNDFEHLWLIFYKKSLWKKGYYLLKIRRYFYKIGMKLARLFNISSDAQK